MKFKDLLQMEKEDNDIICTISNKILILLFDIEEEDLEKNTIGENNEEINFSENKSSEDDNNIFSDEDEDVNDNNLEDLIKQFKFNIDKAIKNYAGRNNYPIYNDINSKKIISSKRISPDFNNSIFELLYDKESEIIEKENKVKIGFNTKNK